MAEAIIAPFAQDIITNLLHILAEETKLAWGYKGEVKRLERRLKRTLKLLADAEDRSEKEDMKEWLKDLKGAANDAVAVLDEFGYEVLRQKIEVRGRFKNKVTDFFSSHNPIAFRLNLAHKVRNVNLLLDDIKKDALGMGLTQKDIRDLPLLADIPSTSKKDALGRTNPGVDQKSAVGREEDVSTIVKHLLNSQNDKDLPVISICGMGGLGKSYLAKLVLRDTEVASHFNEKIWVSVSTDFEVNRLLSEMAQSVTQKDQKLSNDHALQKLLSGELKGKRYLLILDDVWSTDPAEWESMRTALLGIEGSMGGKIIVTCRDKKVAETMNSFFIHKLEELSEVDSWTLFRNNAFTETNPVEEFEGIGRALAKRCRGVPLALIVLGRFLRSKKSIDDWLTVSRDNFKSVQDILKLSYNRLSPSPLKSCFAFMSIFPKDSDLEKSFVVQLWTAIGLLPAPEKSKSILKDVHFDSLIEDVGDNYFDLLIEKSLLQDARMDSYGNIEKSRMHDLVHDLAVEVSKGYCFTVDGDGSNGVSDIPNDVVHLNFLSPRIEAIELAGGCFQTLQTLILARSLPENVVTKLERLRVLVLRDYGTKELPPSIGKLKYLRVLDASKSFISRLPSSITKLYYLQTLKVRDIVEVPERFGDLVNLRHFCFGAKVTLTWMPRKKVMLPGLGKLTLLQTLPRFVVCREKGCPVGELGGLSNLKGRLEIHGLEDVKDEEEAKSAKLVDKLRIEALEFYWEESNREVEVAESDKVEAVLKGLRPHSSLKRLSINNFKGVKFPSWMISASDFALNNLVELELNGCDRCEQVPTLGHLRNLKKLEMRGLKRVRKIGQEFYYYGDNQNMVEYFSALRELVLFHMEMLEEWEDVKQLVCVQPSSSSSSLPRRIIQFRNLEKLSIRYCRKLIRVPSGRLSSLKKLMLEDVNPRMEVQRMSSWGLTCLTHLQLWDVQCVGLERVIEEWFKNNTTSLVEVDIWKCNKLVKLQPRSSLFNDCVALKELNIRFCSKLKVIPDLGGGGRGKGIRGLAQSLRKLDITNCPEVECLPRGIETLMSLQTLYISGGINHEIPRMPSSLQTLWLIGSWGNVKQLPQQQLGHLSSLEELSLFHMEGLEALPEWLQNLNNLKTLSIRNCKNLKEMPTSEATRHVTRLEIWRCPEILKERCVKESGADWPRIQHIQYIIIDNEPM